MAALISPTPSHTIRNSITRIGQGFPILELPQEMYLGMKTSMRQDPGLVAKDQNTTPLSTMLQLVMP